MSDVIIPTRFQWRRDTAANWAANNPIPLDGEPCVETDAVWPISGRPMWKLGDGVTPYNDLEYATQDAGGGVSAGTSFPGSPTTNDLFYRTDRSLLYFYDGTQWLTVQQYEVGIGGQQNVYPSATAVSYIWWPVRQDYGIYLERWVCTTFVSTTNNGSNNWTILLDRFSTTNSLTNIASFSTSADTASNWISHSQAINAVLDSSARAIRVASNKTGNPGTVYALSTLVYRLIG